MKKLISLLLAVAMLLSLAACATNQNNNPTDGPSDTQPQTQTQPQTPPQDVGNEDVTVVTAWASAGGDAEYLQSMVDKFNKENKDNIYINLVFGTGYTQIMQMAFDGGTAPDIWCANGFDSAQFMDTGILECLEPYMKADEEYMKVNQPFDNAFIGKNLYDGKVWYAYSGMATSNRVIYNKDLLEKSGYTEIPTKLDDFVEMVKKITEDGKGEYYGIGLTQSSPIGRLMEPIAQASGRDKFDYVNGKFQYDVLDPVLKAFKDIIDSEACYPEYGKVDNMRALFAEGQFAIWANGSGEAGVFTDTIPITDFEWATADVPTVDGEVKGANTMTPQQGWAMISSSKNKDAAWKVISFLQSEEYLTGLVNGGYTLPVSEYMQSKYDPSNAGNIAKFVPNDHESVYPVIIGTFAYSGTAWQTVLWDALTTGNKTLEEAYEYLNTQYNQCYDDAISQGLTKRVTIPDFDPLNPSSGDIVYQEK